MGFVPPPVPTGNPARDRIRFHRWIQEREQEATFQFLCLLGIGAMVAAASLGWLWNLAEIASSM